MAKWDGRERRRITNREHQDRAHKRLTGWRPGDGPIKERRAQPWPAAAKGGANA